MFCPLPGCNARSMPVDYTATVPWEDTVERFWHQISDLNQKAGGVLQNIKASQLSRELE